MGTGQVEVKEGKVRKEKYEYRYDPVLFLIRELDVVRGDLKEFRSYVEHRFVEVEAKVDRKFDEVNKRVDEVRVELSQRVEDVRSELSQRIDGTNKRVDSLYKLMVGILVAVLSVLLTSIVGIILNLVLR
ncbi:MAG: hypothetical protein RMJ37_07615 [Spirochaetia bacterium]|nr:hypothetical protein [Spirochaetota bacterium]MCX8097138.1 hypothetical protein [Spirochaetota bacterium]MDW8113181.1 hypothetical protein [Spirochaetia bacterium]